MTDNYPAEFYNDLDLSLNEIRAVLQQGMRDRKCAAHHPVIANVDENGGPQQRVMILRECNWDQRSLRFHTDHRSTKVAQYDDQDKTSVLIYDEAKKLQIRLLGTARIQTGDTADMPWASSTPFARRCYMCQAAPGSNSDIPTSGLPSDIEGAMPNEEQLSPYRGNFALLIFAYDKIEWLYLANAGHRRARWQWNATNNHWQGEWLIP